MLSNWKKYPVFWNEFIVFPVPYLDRILVQMAKADRAEGLKRIQFVASERSLQRWAAVKALQELFLDSLSADSFRRLGAISDDVLPDFEDSQLLSEDLQAHLPKLHLISQDARSYLNMADPYRRSQKLRDVLTSTQTLQHALTLSSGKMTPRLLSAVNGWRALLEEEKTKLDAEEEAERPIAQLFIHGQSLDEDRKSVFIGRDDIVARIESDILNSNLPPLLFLQGPRRMGKSSILKQLPSMLGSQFASCIIDAQNSRTVDSLPACLSWFSMCICEGMKKRQLAFQPLKREELAVDAFSTFDDWLLRLESELPTGLRILICLDEYEKLQEAVEKGWGEAILDYLRNLFQNRPALILMLTGSKTFEEMGSIWTSRFISSRRIRVGRLRKEELRTLLLHPSDDFNMEYELGAVDAILDAANGQPNLTQNIAHDLVVYMNEEKRFTATIADVETAIERTLDSGSDTFFVNYWNDAEEEGQAILRAIVQGAPIPNHPKGRSWLIDNDVITPENAFVIPIMERWVRRKLSPTLSELG